MRRVTHFFGVAVLMVLATGPAAYAGGRWGGAFGGCYLLSTFSASLPTHRDGESWGNLGNRLRSCFFERRTVRGRGYTTHGQDARATSGSFTGGAPVLRGYWYSAEKERVSTFTGGGARA